jgi:hypothetical protein
LLATCLDCRVKARLQLRHQLQRPQQLRKQGCLLLLLLLLFMRALQNNTVLLLMPLMLLLLLLLLPALCL